MLFFLILLLAVGYKIQKKRKITHDLTLEENQELGIFLPSLNV
jgi:hypothetical protein